MLAIRVEHDLIGRDELLRAVLAACKLKTPDAGLGKPP